MRYHYLSESAAIVHVVRGRVLRPEPAILVDWFITRAELQSCDVLGWFGVDSLTQVSAIPAGPCEYWLQSPGEPIQIVHVRRPPIRSERVAIPQPRHGRREVVTWDNGAWLLSRANGAIIRKPALGQAEVGRLIGLEFQPA